MGRDSRPPWVSHRLPLGKGRLVPQEDDGSLRRPRDHGRGAFREAIELRIKQLPKLGSISTKLSNELRWLLGQAQPSSW